MVHTPLLERDAELSAVADLIDDDGSGAQVLAVEGPPGIGKTALLAEARRLAPAAGWQLLAARGSELERPFAYGVVRQLLEPLLISLAEEERAALLAGPAALAAPVFDVARVAVEPGEDPSLATLHGLYWLTANLAARRPLLLAIDDLHWSDLPSLRWLAYLLPRIEGLPVRIVLSLRPDEAAEDPALLDSILSDPVAVVVRPAPLGVEAATRFVRDALSADADAAFSVACREEAAGNPLLLRELLHAVAEAGLEPTEANLPRLRELGGRAGSRAASTRLLRLPAAATTLAQAVALLGDDADPRLAAQLAGLDEQSASEAAAALGRADVLRPQPPLGFVHPLLRSAVYESLAPLERDLRHAAAARLLAAGGAGPEHVAAHLLRSSPAADPASVAALREAARRASRRGASQRAVAYLRRALEEPPAPAERAALLLELGTAEAGVSGTPSIAHLQQAHAAVGDPVERARAALVLGRQLFLLHRGPESDAVYEQALGELAGADPELARLLEAGLIVNGLFVPQAHEAAVERLQRVRRDPADASIGQKLLLSLLAYHDARAGSPASGVVPLARRALAGGTLLHAEGAGGTFVPPSSVLAMADLDEVLAVYEDALTEAHRRGSTFASAAVKVFRAQTLVWRGDLGEAEADAREALAAGEAWGPSARFAGHARAFLADSLMEQGRLGEAAAVLQEGRGDAPQPDSARLLYQADSSARLRLLRGDVAGGLAELRELGRRFEEVGSRNPAFIAWRSPAALALHRLGEQDEAAQLATEELELARRFGAPRALGVALRAAGLVEGGAPGRALLEEAVDVLAASPARLEHARARTELGSALRRAGRRSQAREQLRLAVELAALCGAEPLRRRAQSELLATGARPRRIALSGVASLTPSERRVAEIAAVGTTNREIAQTLFVTQRTVEVHLTSIYRKLAIRSRVQLSGALAGAA